MKHEKRSLGALPLALITVSAIVSLRNLPLSAEYGLSSIFYFVVSALVFFIPIALVTAELATGWPKAGGNYIWVSEAFGKPVGFFALWIAWMESIAWFPAILAFTASMLAHWIEPWFPELVKHGWFHFSVMISVFWGATFLNFYGIQTSSWFSSLGVLSGTIIPGVLMIGLGCWWVLKGGQSHIPWNWDALIPDFRLDNMVFFSGILLGLAGVELAAFHIREASHPQRDYPRALAMASVVIIAISILGTLSIAVVVPQKDISLLSGLIQAFQVFFSAFHLESWVPVMALLALIGSLAGINTWTIGPAKGLLVTANDGFLPKALKRTNHRGVPTGMLIFQASVGTLLSFAFLWMDSHNSAFWVLTALSAQFAVVQYIFVFAAVIKLRYSQPKVHRPYRVPGGTLGVCVIAIVGILACAFGFFIVFVPPVQLDISHQNQYPWILAVSFMVLSIIPIIFSILRSKKAKTHRSH